MSDEAETSEQTEAKDATIDQTPAPAQREPREIVPFNAGGGLNALIPQSPEEYARMGELLILGGCVPSSYESRSSDPDIKWKETRAALIIGLMKAVEIGVPPITGLNGIMIVNNRPSVWGDLAISLIQQSGALEKMEVRKFGPEPAPGLDLSQWDSGFGYRVAMWRVGQEMPYIGEFTVGDARRAQLWQSHKKKPWINYPMDMLFNRARAKASRMGFADALHGMSIIEEARDVAPEAEKSVDTEALFSDEPEVEPIEEQT